MEQSEQHVIYRLMAGRGQGGPRLNGPQHEKTCLWGFANNTGTDQPAHPCSLIRAIAICLLESIIARLATREISII